MTGFLHGVEVVEIDAGSRPIQSVKSAVIGIVGTAPDVDPLAFPLNTPVLVAGSRREAAGLDTVGDLAGTLPAAMDGIPNIRVRRRLRTRTD
jgi:phage tail sheath protein FI